MTRNSNRNRVLSGRRTTSAVGSRVNERGDFLPSVNGITITKINGKVRVINVFMQVVVI